jgi:hypothetical protein
MIILHRINSAAQLAKVPPHYGVEIDIRTAGKNLILNHEPFATGELLATYLQHFRHRFIIANIKEAGIEDEVVKLFAAQRITDYFLLDVEFPYIYRASRKGMRKIALRFSEEESIETVKLYCSKVDWLWIDCFTQLPLNASSVTVAKEFKSCLVSPERWQRPEDIPRYQQNMKDLGFQLDAVMTEARFAPQWEEYFEKRN